MSSNNRLDFDNISLEEVPNIRPTLEHLSAPNNIKSFIDNEEIFNLGMEYGMLKISTSAEFQNLLVNNLENKERDSRFQIRVREQSLNELELSNRSNQFFEHQLKAFDSINLQSKRTIPKHITTPIGETFTPYELYVEIMRVFNSDGMDSDGRFLKPQVNKVNKREFENQSKTLSDSNSAIKKRKTLRSQQRRNYNYDSPEHSEINKSKWFGDDWMVPNPKTCRFLQNPNKKSLSFSLHSLEFWSSISQAYECLYHFYEVYLKDYILALFKYEGAKPWSSGTHFKTNGVSILHHMSTEEDNLAKEEDNVVKEEDNVVKEEDNLVKEEDNGGLEERDVCKKCGDPKRLYQCNYCQEFYHKTCIPALKGKYGSLCDNCLLGNFEYGFQELETTVTIEEFRNRYESRIPYAINNNDDLRQIEMDFWNTVYGERRVTSFYGADIHNDKKDYISGFENQKSERIASSFLNLMNLPSDENTLLPLLNDISGISLPWCYFGSKFSTFGIHMEDHFAYSINYQFEGECKIWYCIKISDADKFYQYVSMRFPDFLKRQKDILHQLTATISPYDKHIHETMGITFYKAVQRPGDYIITFPKCWHFGFNLGFNHNEAVNFILPNWIPFALEAVDVYKRDNRKNVFDIYKLLQKNMIVNNDMAYSDVFFVHVENLIRDLNAAEELLSREFISEQYKSIELDITDFSKSFMVNEISCDCCKKICSFSMVLKFNDRDLYDMKKDLTLKDILINSRKINESDNNADYENVNNFILSNSDELSSSKRIELYCTSCFIEGHKNSKNYLLTQSYFLKDAWNQNKIFKREKNFGFPVGFA